MQVKSQARFDDRRRASDPAPERRLAPNLPQHDFIHCLTSHQHRRDISPEPRSLGQRASSGTSIEAKQHLPTMYGDISKPPQPLPQPRLHEIQPGLCLLPPLTRSGQGGPGIIVIVSDGTPSLRIEKGVPSPLLKWAEEGYAVAEVKAFTLAGNAEVLKQAVEALNQCKECETKEKMGLVSKLSFVVTCTCTES